MNWQVKYYQDSFRASSTGKPMICPACRSGCRFPHCRGSRGSWSVRPSGFHCHRSTGLGSLLCTVSVVFTPRLSRDSCFGLGLFCCQSASAPWWCSAGSADDCIRLIKGRSNRELPGIRPCSRAGKSSSSADRSQSFSDPIICQSSLNWALISCVWKPSCWKCSYRRMSSFFDLRI